MARKKSSQADLLATMSTILIPEEYLKDFEVSDIENRPSEWVIDLIEKEDRVPEVLKGKGVVLDGYCNPISLMTNAFAGKKIYTRRCTAGDGKSRVAIRITAMNMICIFRA